MMVFKRKYPKVLIVNSQSIYKNNATGITLRSLFDHWPSDRVMEIYHWKPLNYTNESFNISSEQLPPKAMPIYYIIRKLAKKDCVCETTSGITSPTQPFEDMDSISDAIRKALKMLLEYTPICLNRQFLEKIDDFSPDVIYTLSASVFINRMALYFSRRYRKKIVIHYMDNWRETDYMNNKHTKCLNNLMNRSVKKIEQRMECGLTISEKMAVEYRGKFGNRYEAIMNSIDILPELPSIKEKGKEFIITYAGGLHLGRHKSLLDLQGIIEKINFEDEGSPIALVIYTSNQSRNQYEAMFDKSVTVFKNYLPHDQVIEIYNEADILVHIESFEEAVQNYIKYSISTKIPEYMASGKPILCYAPEGIAVSEYILKTESGICANNVDSLECAIKKLIKNDELRTRLGKNGVDVARRYHTKTMSNDILCSVLSR